MEIISKAMDLYSRLCMGQMEIVAEFICDHAPKNERTDYDAIRTVASMMKEALGLPENGTPGIYSDQVQDQARIAWDIRKVIDHRISWDKNPKGGMQIMYDKPNQAGALPLVEITKVG
jgi:hypothetical protein